MSSKAWNKGFTSIKKRGMLFKDWCVVNHFEYMIPELDEEYSRENFGLDLSNLTHGNDKLLKWKCSNPSHPPFYAKTVHRTNGQRLLCQYCNGSRLSLLEHSVALDLKNLVDTEWCYDLNTLKPEEMSSSSVTKVWWRCSKCGQTYESSPSHRKEGKGCPYCANLKVKVGVNDLFTTNPELKSEWDFDLNVVNPLELTHGSDLKVCWICPKGHSYEAIITSRAGRKTGCPICNTYSTSFPEQAFKLYLSYSFTDLVHRFRGFGVEYDFYLPEEGILIEYNGFRWHKGKEDIDDYKKRLAKSKGLYFIRINAVRDDTYRYEEHFEDGFCEISCYCEKAKLSSIDSTVYNVLRIIFCELGVNVTNWSFINCKRDYEIIYNMMYGGK